MTAPVVEITGELVGQRRQELGLSRENFAALVQLTPGAVWRIEVKHKFKPGEVDHLADIAERWLTGVPAAPQTPARRPTPPPPKATPAVLEELAGEDLELIQWLDPAAEQAAAANVLARIVPQPQPSPTELTAQDGVWRLSNSEVQTFKRCRRKWWLTYHRGLRSTYEDPFGARAVGTRGHLALQAWYRPDPKERVDPRDAIEAIIAHERAQLDAAVAADKAPTEALVRFNKEVELDRIILEGYVQWLADTGSDSDYEVVGSEQYLEARLPEYDNIMIVARLDARVRRITDGLRLFIDHKFVGSIPQAVRLLPLNEQMLFYILIENLQDSDEPAVAGALYNMLRRVKRTEKATPPFYDRVEVHHNLHSVKSFRQRLIGTIDDIGFVREELEEGTAHQLVAYPTPTKDCAWDCPFLKVCPMFDDGSRVEDAIEANFTKGDPYGYYRSSIEKTE